MNVPDVSVNGVIGNTTSNSLKESDMYGEIARLNFAFLSAEFIFWVNDNHTTDQNS